MKKVLKPFGKKIDAEIVLPGSKSITNRVYIYSALSSKKTELKGLLESEDTYIMRNALKKFGIKIKENVIHGGIENFVDGDIEIFCGNSGTSMRFLCALASLRNGETLLFGKDRMHKRPIEPLLKSLRDLGVDAISINNDGCPPVLIRGNGKIKGGHTTMRGNLSSQFFSALIAIAPFAKNPVKIEIDGNIVSAPYIKMTISILRQFGVFVDFDNRRIRIKSQKYKSPNTFQLRGISMQEAIY